MARRRLFVRDVSGGYSDITGEDAHHLARVLRAQPGQLFEISDNQRLYLAEVESVTRDALRLRVREELPAEPEAGGILLFAALIKFERFEWIVEKATELGATAIVPVAAGRSEKGLLEAAQKRVERWRRIARESSQQSRRMRLPDVAAPRTLAAALVEPAGLRCYLDEQGGEPLMRAATAAEAAIAVGPEGGWTDAERRAFDRFGWRAVSLGPGILRAETAAIAALAVLSHTSWARRADPSAAHPLQ